MKKMLIALIILSNLIVISYANTVKKTKTTGNESTLTGHVGKIDAMAFGYLREREYNYNMQTHERLLGIDEAVPLDKRIAAINEFKAKKSIYEQNRYFVLTINHEKKYKFDKGNLIISMSDSTGKIIQTSSSLEMDYFLESNSAFKNSYYVHRWILKTEKPITKINFNGPVTVTIKLFNDYVLTYTIEPE